MEEFEQWVRGVLAFFGAYLAFFVLLLALFIWVPVISAVTSPVWDGDCRIEGAEYCSAKTIQEYRADGKNPDKECFIIDTRCFVLRYLGIEGVSKDTAGLIAGVVYLGLFGIWIGVFTALLIATVFAWSHGYKLRRLESAEE